MNKLEVSPLNDELYQLYLNDCKNKDIKPSLKDYLIWVEEEYGS